MHVFDPAAHFESAPAIYGVGGGPLCEETWRAADIALLGFRPSTAVLFLPAELPWRRCWSHWTCTQFDQLIAPHLVESHLLAADGVLELADRDRALCDALSTEQRRLSLRAGRQLLERYQGARHLRPLQKLARLVESGETPGHAASVLALQSLHFNVSPAATLLAYLLLEWTATHHALRMTVPGRRREAFLDMTPDLPILIQSWLASTSNPAFQPATDA